MELRDRVALVTGAGRRVGRAIALELAGHGARLAIHYHTSAEAASEVAAEARAGGVEVATFAADLTQPAEIDTLAAAVLARFGSVQVLVHSAADFLRTPIGEVRPEDWDRLHALNLKAPFFLSQALAPSMRAAGGGRIVMIADVAGLRPWPAYLPYGATKAGLVFLTRGLARALAPEVLVNAVAPGTVLPAESLSEEEIAAEARRTLVGRVGTADDVARAVAFLVSSDFTTGQVLAVDGGRLWC